jgi:hypothetical protein
MGNALLLAQARDAKQTATNAWTDAQAHLVKAGQTAFAARMDANLASSGRLRTQLVTRRQIHL